MKPQINLNIVSKAFIKYSNSNHKPTEEKKKNIHISIDKSKINDPCKQLIKSPVHVSNKLNNYKIYTMNLEKRCSNNSKQYNSPKASKKNSLFSPSDSKKFTNILTNQSKNNEMLITSIEGLSHYNKEQSMYRHNDHYQVGHFNESSYSKEKPQMITHTEYNSIENLEKMQEPLSLDEDDKISLEKDSLAVTYKSTIEGKNEIIEALNNKIKVLEKTLKGYESSKVTPNKKALSSKKMIIVNLEKTIDLKSRKLPSSNQDKVGNLKKSSTKKNLLFINEVSNTMKNTHKQTEKKGSRHNSPYLNKTNMKNTEENLKKIHVQHSSMENNDMQKQLEVIRERTKSVLDKYKENNNSLVIRIRSMNNSEVMNK